jgi:nitrogen fixation/metabolism regulation signal transduction histidine kinase
LSAHPRAPWLVPRQVDGADILDVLIIGGGQCGLAVAHALMRSAEQVEAMKAMVNDFSNYARAPKIQAEPLVLDRLVCEVLDLYRSAGGEVGLDVSLGASGVRILGDPLRLRQVVHNLIKNAQEAMEGQTGGRIHVRTLLVSDPQVAPEGPLVELCIADEGPGIETDMLGRLFEPYVTTKTKGTGLGLAIVKHIVNRHRGGLTVESAPGEGAAFTAYFPVAPGRDTVTTARQADVSPSTT